jgi:hypothetical protein
MAKGLTMTSPPSALRPAEKGKAARKTGYGAAVVVNLVLLLVINNLLEWDWFRFLTADFGPMLWLINVSLVATVLINLVWLGYDPVWFRSLSQIGLNLISAVVTIRMYQVFPFDFSTYEFNWTPIARFVIILTMVGLALGTITELVKLVPRGVRTQPFGSR